MIPDRERWWSEFEVFDQVRVFNVDASASTDREKIALQLLDLDETKRWGNFVRPEPRLRFALCRAALRAIVCDLIRCENTELNFPETEMGKPYATLNGQKIDVSFNVSHSGDHALIAIGETPALGVDVEFRRQHPNLELLVSTVLSPAEKEQIASISHQREKNNLFFDFWTIKEAVLKAVGVGMSGPDPSEIEVPREMREGNRSCVTQFNHFSQHNWQLVNLGTPKFAAAVAYMVD